jgi:hypothetical protein
MSSLAADTKPQMFPGSWTPDIVALLENAWQSMDYIGGQWIAYIASFSKLFQASISFDRPMDGLCEATGARRFRHPLLGDVTSHQR